MSSRLQGESCAQQRCAELSTSTKLSQNYLPNIHTTESPALPQQQLAEAGAPDRTNHRRSLVGANIPMQRSKLHDIGDHDTDCSIHQDNSSIAQYSPGLQSGADRLSFAAVTTPPAAHGTAIISKTSQGDNVRVRIHNKVQQMTSPPAKLSNCQQPAPN